MKWIYAKSSVDLWDECDATFIGRFYFKTTKTISKY